MILCVNLTRLRVSTLLVLVATVRAFLHISIESMDSNSYKRYPPLLLSAWVPLYLLMVLERQKKSIKERYLIPSVLRAGAQRLRPLLGQIVALVAPSLLRHLDWNQTTSYPESLSRKRQVIRHCGPPTTKVPIPHS